MGAQGESRSQITHRRATTMRAIAAILISPALIAAGYVVSWTMKQKDIQLEYVKRAIEIIRYSPTANVDELTMVSQSVCNRHTEAEQQGVDSAQAKIHYLAFTSVTSQGRGRPTYQLG